MYMRDGATNITNEGRLQVVRRRGARTRAAGPSCWLGLGLGLGFGFGSGLGLGLARVVPGGDPEGGE